MRKVHATKINYVYLLKEETKGLQLILTDAFFYLRKVKNSNFKKKLKECKIDAEWLQWFIAAIRQ